MLLPTKCAEEHTAWDIKGKSKLNNFTKP